MVFPNTSGVMDDFNEYHRQSCMRERNLNSIKHKKVVKPSSSKKSISSLGTGGVFNKCSDGVLELNSKSSMLVNNKTINESDK